MTYPRPFLLEHVQELSHFIVPDAAVFYEHDPNYTVGQDATCVKLRWKTLLEQGTPDERHDWDDARQVYSSDFVGWRQGILTIMCESYDAQVEAADVVDGILLRMRRNSSKDARASACVGLVSMSAMTDVQTQYDNRAVSVAAVDVTFNVLNVDSQEDADTWIQTINGNNVIPPLLPADFSGEANGSSSATGSLVVA